MKRTAAASIIATLTLCLALPAAAAEKVTICHAAGLADTTQFVTLTIAEPAVYGPAGHFEENGTPRAGHEQDYFGECPSESTTTTTLPSDEVIPFDHIPTTTTSTTILSSEAGTTEEGSTEEGPTEEGPTNDEISSIDEVLGETRVGGITAARSLSNNPSLASARTMAATPTVGNLTELPFTGVSSGLLAGLALAFAAAGTFLLKLERSIG